MMPLIFAEKNEENIIIKVNGKPEVKKHLEDMGFVSGASIKVVSSVDGNLIVSIKDCKVALNKDLANKIMI